MLPTRYVPGGAQSSALRKSRLDARPSMLPKPRRQGSTDRLSVEARRSAAARSSSAEPPRGTFGARLSREASATKLPMNGRSRSHTTEQKFGQTSMTPLRSSQYSRPTTTPQRTPSEDRASRTWQMSLDRALAFVTVKDQRVISNVAWQRSWCTRVGEQLSARGGTALIRPLTIARFVDIAGSLLNSLMPDTKLNTDNYVAKLPHVVKRLLYPGAVSKSWLKTVNTLHAFPHALALLAYLLDLVNHVEMPVLDEWLYADKDDLGQLRRDYLHKCWIRFQDPEHEFEELNQQYLQSLQALLGDDAEKIKELQNIINQYETCLEDEADLSARAHEQRLVERRQELAGIIRTERGLRKDATTETQEQHRNHKSMLEDITNITNEIHSAQAESHQLTVELESQTLSVAERSRLLDEVFYASKVHDSKRALAIQIEKLLQSKELELSSWQQRSLESCVQYRKLLIHLAADHPSLAALAIDENSLMDPSCMSALQSGTECLKSTCSQLAATRNNTARTKTQHNRQRIAQQEEVRAQLADLQTLISRELLALDSQSSAEAQEALLTSRRLEEIAARVEELRGRGEEYAAGSRELEYREQIHDSWRSKLSAMQESINNHKQNALRLLEAGVEKRTQIVAGAIQQWQQKL